MNRPDLNVFGGAESLDQAVINLHQDCTGRAAGKDNNGDPVPPADPDECMREVRRFFIENKPTFVDDGGDSCDAAWDRDLQKIVVKGPEALCRPLFPESSKERRELVEKKSYEYRRNTSMNGATDMKSAAAKIFAFCATEPGIDRERCRAEAEDLLRTIDVSRGDGSGDTTNGCVGRFKYDDDGGFYLAVDDSGGSLCTTEFPDKGPERDTEIDAGGSIHLTGTNGMQTLVAGLFQNCDEQPAATPDQIAQCKQTAADQLGSEQIEFVTTADGPCLATRDSATSRIVVTGPATCRQLLPDGVTASAEAVNQAALAYQQLEALRGTADLRAATTALYAVCDRVPESERAACRAESESLLKKVTVVRTGTGCAAELGADRNTPTIVVGPNCAEAFPEEATNRELIVRQAATEYVPPTGPAAETDPVKSLPRVASVPDGQQPAGLDQAGQPGDTKTDPAAGDTKTDPAAGDTKTDPAAGDTKTDPAAGGTKTDPAAGGTKTDPAAGGTKKEPAAGGTKKEPAAGGTKKEPAAGGTKKEPAAGGTKKEPVQKEPDEDETG